MLAGEYARSALQVGLQLEEKFGTNPYKFGLMAATDSSHSTCRPPKKNNFLRQALRCASRAPKRVYLHPMAKVGENEYPGWSMVASGYQGIWARENTREALFDAMMRKETYGTTGPRMLVRFFGGWDFDDADTQSRLPADVGYLKGVPHGR